MQDATTLLYRAAEGSSGQDTISVEVTDGEVGDETSATATLAIPVRIAPEEDNLPPTLQGAVFEIAARAACDVDGNGRADRNDIDAILAARGTAAGVNDPRDFDQDGVVTVLDARACTLRCTKAQCAP